MFKMKLVILGLALMALAGRAAEQRMIANPVAPIGNDPWVTQKDGIYYYCYSWGGGISVKADRQLDKVLLFPGKKVWTPPKTGPYAKEIWAPELHFLRGKWYIYFAADDGQNAHHRMYVLESATDDPTGGYVFKGQLRPDPDRWAIDGSVLQLKDQLYFIWSGWPGDKNGEQDLFIARMQDPWTIAGQRVLISTPELPWERQNHPLINEGPTALYHGNKTFIVYSASGSWANHYCLGLLTLTGKDPLQKTSWTKSPRPVFAGTPSVTSPGHASFTKSPDGTEDWIVYHAARRPDSAWDRNTRIQKFTWSPDGSPFFGAPIAEGVKFAAPRE